MNCINKTLENGDKALAGMPYLYRAKGLPSEVYEVRMYKTIDGEILQQAVQDALERYPYFSVRFQERKGDFYAVPNENPLTVHHTDECIPLGGHSNDYHLMGITYWENSMRLSFHHGLTDGRGAKAFLEEIVQCYKDYLVADKNAYFHVREQHLQKAREISPTEWIDPCEKKHEMTGSQTKIQGLSNRGYRLPETKKKSAHRRYELKFSQEDFMASCKAIGASPIIYLSMLVSRSIQALSPENTKPIVSNFPMDARAILGCENTFKNCVKSMMLPYGSEEATCSDTELANKYKALLLAQRNHDYCAKEFNNIHMLLQAIGHFHSVSSRRKFLGFMENLALNTYLISYVGQFHMPEELVEEVHLYSNCSNGLVFNMTCQSGCFIIDVVQDFETDCYVNAIGQALENVGIPLSVSEEIVFETPCDELAEIVTSPSNTLQQIQSLWEHFVTAAKKSTETAKQRAEATRNFHPHIPSIR